MKIVHLSYSDIIGGASRAAYRVHKMLLDNSIDSSMFVNVKKFKDISVYGHRLKFKKILKWQEASLKISSKQDFKFRKIWYALIHLYHPNWLKKINSCDADIIHLHWVQGEMISIKEISKIKNTCLDIARYVAILWM